MSSTTENKGRVGWKQNLPKKSQVEIQENGQSATVYIQSFLELTFSGVPATLIQPWFSLSEPSPGAEAARTDELLAFPPLSYTVLPSPW